MAAPSETKGPKERTTPCCNLIALTVSCAAIQLLASAVAIVVQVRLPHTGGTRELWGAYLFWTNILDVAILSIATGLPALVFAAGLPTMARAYVLSSRRVAKAAAAKIRTGARWLTGTAFLASVYALSKVMFAAVHDTRDPAFWTVSAALTLCSGATALALHAAVTQALSTARRQRLADMKGEVFERSVSSAEVQPSDGGVAVQLSPRVGRRGVAGSSGNAGGGAEGVQAHPPSSEAEEAKSSTGANIARLLSLAGADGLFLALGFGGLCIAAAAQTALPLYTGKVVDAVAIKGDKAAFHEGIIILVCVALAAGVFAGVRGSMMTVAFSRLKVRLRQRLFDALVMQDMAYFDTVRTGELVSRMAADVTKVGDSISLQLNIFLRSSIQALGTLGFMLSLSWQLTIVVFMMVPPLTLLTKVYGEYVRKLYKRIQSSIAVANAVAQETLGAIATVKTLGAEGAVQQHHASKLGTFLHLSVMQALAYFLYVGIFTFMPSAITAALLYAGGWLIFHGRVSPGALISFLLYQVTLTDALSSIANVFSGLMQAVGAADKVFRIMDSAPTVRETGRLTLPRRQVQGRLSFTDVHFAYPTRPQAAVLRGFTLDIQAGQSVALVGGSGNGKSSVIRLLQRFYDPTAGSICLDGRPLGQYDVTWRRRVIGLVQQEPVLLARSVRDNIVLGLESESLRWGDEVEEEGDSSEDSGEEVEAGEEQAIWGEDSSDDDDDDEEGGVARRGPVQGGVDVEGGYRPLLGGAQAGGAGQTLSRKQRAEQRAMHKAIKRRRAKEASGEVKRFKAPGWATEAAFLADMQKREADLQRYQRLFAPPGGDGSVGPQTAHPHTGDAATTWQQEATAQLRDIYDTHGRVKQSAVEAAARLADAHAFVQKLPHGYDTLCGERGTSLSGGQKQRIALARAILRNPVVLALDEATSALDAASEHAVQQAVNNLMADRSRTVLIIAHRLSTVRSCDVICVVLDGRVVESGSHEALLAKRGHYFDLVQRQLDSPQGTAEEDHPTDQTTS